MSDPKKKRDSLILTVLLLALAVGIFLFAVLNSPKRSSFSDNSRLPKCSSIKQVQVLPLLNSLEPEVVAPEPIVFEISLPPTMEQLIDIYVDDICELYPDVDPDFVRSIIWNESRYCPDAVGWKGEYLGLMQISPEWHSGRAARLGVTDWFDPYGNILVGVDIINEIQLYADDPTLVAMCYNLGPSDGISKYRRGEINEYAKDTLDYLELIKSGVKIYAS